MDQTSPQEGMSVSEAAVWLGVTEDAVRKRIHRGRIRYEQGEDGRYWVYPTEEDKRQYRSLDASVSLESSALISHLQEEIEYLREENRRKDEIIVQQAMTMRALGSPPELRESPEAATEGEDRGEPRPEEARRGFWARLFGP